MMILAGDIGGTKTDLAIFSHQDGPHSPLVYGQRFSADYPSLQAMVTEFVHQAQISVDRACFDVAGPVIDGHVKITNLPWTMDEISLAKDLNLKSVHLMNDLEAVARAIPILRVTDVHTLNAGQPIAHGAIGVVAPGTGLGESFLTWDGSKYVSHSSEGGHADFAPTSDREIGLLRYLLARFDHVAIERVCSGIGIPNIYEYLRDIEHIPENPEVGELIAISKDPTAAIVNAAVNPGTPSTVCRTTVESFISILAGEAGNLALRVMATGGIFLGGGIPLHMLTLLSGPKFMESFTRKGRFAGLMKQIPVHVILSRAALVGAAAYGLENSPEES